MAGKQHKKSNQQRVSDNSDDQIINDLIENRKRQMEALVKIMSSFEETPSVHVVPLKPKPKSLKKIFKRKPKH